MFKVCLLVFLACVALSGVTADPIPINGTLTHRLGYTKNETAEADPSNLQKVVLEDDGLMTEVKNESNERLGPLKNGKEETKEPLFKTEEQYTNSRHYIVTKTRPKNTTIEKFTYD